MLQIRNIRKTYSTGKIKVEALKGISLDFPETGLVFIVGKSGSGKSTLLNILGGLDKMSSGEIVIDGKSTSQFSTSDFDAFRNFYIGFIFQDFNLIDEITVYDNIALALKIQTKGHDSNTIEDSLKMVGLEGLGYRKPNELSGGQRQRVSIARALVKDPKIILADEPTGALDSKTGEALIVSLKTLSKNKLVIVVTHDEEMAINYGDEIIEIKDGQVINHFVTNENKEEGNKVEILNNLVKYHAGKEINNEEEINSKINENVTNYVCVNTSKEIVSLAYSDSFPYLYERKEGSNRFDEAPKDAKGALIKTNDKKIKNKAHIKLIECIKMAFQSFKRKKNRFISLVIISIASLFLFSLGWLFSSIDVPSIVANNSHDLNLPISYIYTENDEYYYMSSKNEITSEEKQILEEKYNQSFAYLYQLEIDYVNPSGSSSSIFSLNSFGGVIETSDVKNLNFEVEGKSILEDKEIIISDYAASELVRTGYIGKVDNKKEVIYPKEISEVLNTQIAFINYDDSYEYLKIVGIIDTDYEDYQHLISKNLTTAYLDDEASNFQTLKNNVYSLIFAKEGFVQNNKKLINDTFDGEILLNFELDYKDEKYINSLFLYFYNGDESSTAIKRLDGVSNLEAVYGEIPDKLLDNQILIPYSMISYLETDQELDEVMKNFKITSFEFQKYKGNYVNIEIAKEIEVIGVFNDAYYGEPFIVTSDTLYSTFFEKVMNIQSTDLVFALSNSLEANNRLLTRLFNDGYSIGGVVGIDVMIQEIVDIVGPVLIYVSLFFAVFAFLIVFNFVSSSVRSRKKEVGILRSMGARNKDVFKIFGTELFIMGCIITLVTLLLVNSTVNSLNDSIPGLISLTIFKDLFIFIVCLFFLLIASILPLIKILKHNPIDAIRKVF